MASDKPKYRIKKDVRPRKGPVIGARGQANANATAGVRSGKPGAGAHNIGRLTKAAARLTKGGARESAKKRKR